jgi:hypothetical protein
MGLDNHDSMPDEMSSIQAIMYQKGAHEERQAEKRHHYHNCTDFSTPMVHYAVHVGLLLSTGKGKGSYLVIAIAIFTPSHAPATVPMKGQTTVPIAAPILALAHFA